MAILIQGVVVQGQQLGRKLGFPTANIALPSEPKCKDGVYVAGVEIEGDKREYLAVANLGSNPSVGGCKRRLEVHIIDYNGSPLYGKELKVTLKRYLRGETHFTTLEELKSQIQRDILSAKEQCLRGEVDEK
ncbi:MAG: riboflavin kinase [Alistipes sp.]|nr:riboflavin kinase [Alistipes sp.]